MPYVDLHVHSTASDGSLTPEAVVALGKARGLAALALTDHDTVAGLDAALAAGERLGIEVIPGIEISARYAGGGGSMHILGYFIDHRHPGLDGQLAVLQQARADRNPQIIEKLNKLDIHITMDDVRAASGGGQIGRPHIARALLAAGYISHVQEAFDRYLKSGGAAYVPKFRFPPEQAIALIRDAGGLAVLAHPFTLGIGESPALKKLVGDLQALGLTGLEVFYPEHSPGQQDFYLQLCRQFALLPTGGSDFHGDNKEGANLGRGPQAPRLTYDLVANLKSRLSRRP